MVYRKRSDFRTIPLPKETDEFIFVMDHLLMHRWATFTGLVVAAGLSMDFDKLDQALRWLVEHKFVRYSPTLQRYTAELRLRGLERRMWPKERLAPSRSPFEGLAKPRPAEPPKPQGPRLQLLLLPVSE